MKRVKVLITSMISTFLGIILLPVVVGASTASINFDSYTLGTINGQDGWSSTGAAGSGCAVYDHAVSGSMGVTGFGAQSLRISNAVTSGCFGDQTFSKSLADEAGESGATNGGMSGGTRQSHFEAQWDIASTVPNAQQPGLFVSFSPDRGDGARMSYLGVSDDPTGLTVIFYDVQQPSPCTPSGCANFVSTTIASGLARNIPHTLKLSMDFVDGPSNDVVKAYVDGALKHTGGSWEDYYRSDPEAAADQNTHTVDSLLIRTGGTAAPATQGNGLLIDNLKLSSGPVSVGPPTSKDQCKNNGWKTFNNPSFKNQGKCIDYVKKHAPAEEVDGTLQMSGPKQKIIFDIDDDHGWNWWWNHNKHDKIEYWNYEYPGGLHYKAKVLCVGGDKSLNEARVMWQIPAGHPGLSGLYVVAYVKEVKHAPDLYGHAATSDEATAKAWCEQGSSAGFSPTMYVVTKGSVDID